MSDSLSFLNDMVQPHLRVEDVIDQFMKIPIA